MEKDKKMTVTLFEKLASKVVPFVLSGIMLLASTGCFNNNNTDDTNTGTSSGVADTSTGTNVDTSNGSALPDDPNTDDKEEKYSELLQSVLNNEYYNSLLAQAKKDEEFFNSNYFYPLPYAFLEGQGHDVEAIKAGDAFTSTYSFVIDEEPNNLYMSTVVGGTGDYYTNYLIRYTLTDKEMEDYKLVTSYIQGVFINDAISATKRAEIISTSKILATAHNNLNEVLEGSLKVESLTGNWSGNETSKFVLNSYDVENQTFEMLVLNFDSFKFGVSTTEGAVYYLPLKARLKKVVVEDGVFRRPSMLGDFGYADDYLNAKRHSVTFFRHTALLSTSPNLNYVK